MEGKISLHEEGALSWQVCSTSRGCWLVTALLQQLGTRGGGGGTAGVWVAATQVLANLHGICTHGQECWWP